MTNVKADLLHVPHSPASIVPSRVFFILHHCISVRVHFWIFCILHFLFIHQMFYPTFVNCTRLMYLHCTFITMSLSLSDKVRLKKYVTKWFYFKLKKCYKSTHWAFFSRSLPLGVSISSFVSADGCYAECWVLSTEYCWVLCWPLNSTIGRF